MAETNTKPWADAPYELIPSSKAGYKKGDKVKASHDMAVEMIIVHNVFLRGINGIYQQCVNVERDPAAVNDFVNYASIWAELVEEHHQTEEEHVFPQLEALVGKPGLMAANVEQHQAFHGGLVEYSRYIKAVLAGEEKYGGQKLRDILDGFMPVLRQHFADEIDTLLKLDEYEDKVDLKKWYDDIQKLIQKKQDMPGVKHRIMPFVLFAHDATFDDGIYANWPPIPWFARLLFGWVFVPKYKNWWRFSPCDVKGRPHELLFAE